MLKAYGSYLQTKISFIVYENKTFDLDPFYAFKKVYTSPRCWST
jgi:hypothetical protein